MSGTYREATPDLEAENGSLRRELAAAIAAAKPNVQLERTCAMLRAENAMLRDRWRREAWWWTRLWTWACERLTQKKRLAAALAKLDAPHVAAFEAKQARVAAGTWTDEDDE